MGLCVGNTAPANSVGFPPLCLQDGPLGIRFADRSTAFPAGLTIGATWNPNNPTISVKGPRTRLFWHYRQS